MGEEYRGKKMGEEMNRVAQGINAESGSGWGVGEL
jgi:hypothetical protein